MGAPFTPPAAMPARLRGRFTVSLARTEEEVTACQRLRYQVFSAELGADVDAASPGLDRDHFDSHCKHMMVRVGATGALVATTRLLTEADAAGAGMFYSETEFDLSPVLALNGRFMEIGRTCVHPAYRGGPVLAMLWQGVAGMTVLNNVDYLIGCASIPLPDPGALILATLEHLRRHHYAPAGLRVTPLHPLPRSEPAAEDRVSLPPLLKGYLRQGALVCGEPCWDPAFRVADVFILLDRGNLAQRYVRHFLQRA